MPSDTHLTILPNTITRFTAECRTVFCSAIFSETPSDDQPSILSLAEVPSGPDIVSEDRLTFVSIGELMKGKVETISLDITVNAKATLAFSLTGHRNVTLLGNIEATESPVTAEIGIARVVQTDPTSTDPPLDTGLSTTLIDETSVQSSSRSVLATTSVRNPNPGTLGVFDASQLMEKHCSLLDVHHEHSDVVVFLDIYRGSGPTITPLSNVQLKYTGQLLDGTIWARPKLPMLFKLAVEVPVIPGFLAGIQSARQGTRRVMIIPPNLGFGSIARGIVPPNSVLIIDCEIKLVEE